MATDTLEHHDHDVAHADHGPVKEDWSGGKAPMKASYGKLMMWYFLLSDAFTFAGFLIAYGTLRVMMPSWPVPDFVFQLFPFTGDMSLPLMFVTLMTFILLFSSWTMVRAVQEGQRENQSGVAVWMFLTILGGAAFLGCQAWEWTTLIVKENMTVTTNPFGTHIESGIYLDNEGNETKDVFEAGEPYLIHVVGGHHPDVEGSTEYFPHHDEPGDYTDALVDEKGYVHKKYKVTEGDDAGMIKSQAFGPIFVNVMSGLYVKRKNGYEMVEKMGLYWHFVDLVWVFVFLLFYLL